MNAVKVDKVVKTPQQGGLRQAMAWLHTWSGLWISWLLFAIFLTGTLAVFDDPIGHWMTPEHALEEAAHANDPPLPKVTDRGHRLELALDFMAKEHPKADMWEIWPVQRPGHGLSAYWFQPAGGYGSADLDPLTGAVIEHAREENARETIGGHHFVDFHYELHAGRIGVWIVAITTMIMLVALVSGVITHKRIFKDFFTFRPAKGQRSWLDAHNVTAVLALPYHIMITYTGLVTLMFLYMPSGATAAYKGDQDAFFAEAFPGRSGDSKPAGVAAPLTPIAPLVRQAEQHWGGGKVERISVNHPGDVNATISLTRAGGRDMSSKQPSMEFDGVSGKLLSTDGDVQPGAAATQGVMVGLHVAHFGGPLLRALFFLSGLAGCAMVATGALLWAVKTRQKQAKALAAGKRASFGLRLVEALNIGAIAGIPIAFGAYFWANRLLPVAMEERSKEEIACFFGVWALAAIIAQLRPSRAMWRMQLAVGAFLLASLPVLNVFTTNSHLGVTLFLGRGPVAVAAFDLVVLVLGLSLAYAAYKLKPLPAKAAKTTPAAKPATTMEAA